MTTVTPRSGLRPAPAAPARSHAVVVRAAGPGDVPALHRLSSAFARSGELRARSLEQYARDAGDFLVAESTAGAVEGCVGLRCHPRSAGPGRARDAVVFNFCVSAASQGRGVGTALLGALLDEAAARAVGTVFTATSGGAALFLRHGFTVVEGAAATWPAALDPREGSRVLRLAL